jgi:hypothetical protein
VGQDRTKWWRSRVSAAYAEYARNVAH